MQLVGMLAPASTGTHTQALVTLQGLATTDQGRSALIAAGIAGPLVALAADISQVGPETVSRALRLWLSLVAEGAGRAALLAAGAAPTLANLISGSTGELQEVALTLFERLAASPAGGLGSDRIRADMVAQGAVRALLLALGGARPRCASLAAAGLARLAAFQGNSAAIVAEGALPPLVALLRRPDSELPEQAACALSKITVTNWSRQQAFEAGALEPLLAVLRDGSPAARTQAAAALASLAGQDTKDAPPQPGEGEDVILPLEAQAFMSAGVLAPAMELLREGPPDGRAEAAHLLLSLMADPKTHDAFVGAGALPLLVRLLADGTPLGQGYAAATLKLFVATAASRREEIEAAVPPQLCNSDGPVPDPRRDNLLRKLRHYAF